ncbi:uncharacterized protein LOC125178415 [Hyalella azteca]|uniref:Uncharacterized protein LOC125178415 n=1 Tax=Hyalella azteca TaxID=294128 RepID=A0A979FLX7_HYAAZ|nr:uncharacterized protein LOC125178415 [Hyalella azteca]
MEAIGAEEGGWPLIIKTSAVRKQAVDLVKAKGAFLLIGKYAWLSAFKVNVAGQPVYVWPDGTRVTDKAFSAKDLVVPLIQKGPKSLLNADKYIEQVAENMLTDYPVLCFKNA